MPPRLDYPSSAAVFFDTRTKNLHHIACEPAIVRKMTRRSPPSTSQSCSIVTVRLAVSRPEAIP